MNSVVFEIEPVFQYRIGDRLKNRLIASKWDISNPVWNGKLQIVQVHPSNRLQVQLVNSDGIFGVVANKEPVGSPMFQKVLDSNRYFTTEIKNTKSGKNEVIGMGFQNRCDVSQLLKALEQYFTSKDNSPSDAPNETVPIKVEMMTEVPDNSQVEVNTLQESESDNATYIQCHSDSRLRTETETTTDIHQKHFDSETSNEPNLDGETSLDYCLELNRTAGDESAQSSSLLVPQSSLSLIPSTTSGECTKEPNTLCRLCHVTFPTPQQRLMHIHTLHIVCDICTMEFGNQKNYNRHVFYAHTRKRQLLEEERTATNHDEHNVERITPSGAENNNILDREITMDTNSGEEAPCSLSKKRKIESNKSNESQGQNKHGIINPIHNPNPNPNPGISDNENGTCCLDPISLEFICPLCSFKTNPTSDMKLLLSHLWTGHDMEKPNMCRLCYIIFSTPEQRLSHISAHHLVCTICSMEFKFERNLQRHVKKTHLKRVISILSDSCYLYMCNRCSKKFENINSLMNHFNLTNNTSQCSSNTTTTSTIVQEYENGINYCLQVVGKPQFNCPLCPKTGEFCSFKIKALLNHWKVEHNLEEPNICRFCNLFFSTAEQRLKHRNAYHIVCSICSVELFKEKNYKRHLENVHSFHRPRKGQEERAAGASPDKHKNICRVLLNSDEDKYEIEEGEITIDNNNSEEESSGQCVPYVWPSVGGHSDNDNDSGTGTSCLDPVTRQLVCPLCGFKTHSKFNMKLLLAHWQSYHDSMEEPINTCRICFTLFSTPGQRLTHVNAHHLTCSICSMEFPMQRNLLKHLKFKHAKQISGLSPRDDNHYVCNRCPKKFDNLMDLMNHFKPTDTSRKLHDDP